MQVHLATTKSKMVLVAWEFLIARAWMPPSGSVIVDGDLRGTAVGNGEPGERATSTGAVRLLQVFHARARRTRFTETGAAQGQERHVLRLLGVPGGTVLEGSVVREPNAS